MGRSPSKMASLSLLQDYQTDSESEEEEEEEDGIVVTIDKKVLSDSSSRPSLKRPLPSIKPKVSQPVGLSPKKKLKPNKLNIKESVIDTQLNVQPFLNNVPDTIPLPSVINTMFSRTEEDDSVHDDPSLHEGRVRSFSHEKNNWASYVYIDLQDCDLDEARNFLTSELELEPIEKKHLSISRVVSLRHHWLQPLVDNLRKELSQEKVFHLSLDKLKVYVNDEKTRTFVGLEASGGCKQLSRLTEKVDGCLREFSLPPFYRPPSFHCSLGWCLGDQRSRIQPRLQKLQLKMVDLLEDDEDIGRLDVRQVTAKTGNKIFQFQLR